MKRLIILIVGGIASAAVALISFLVVLNRDWERPRPIAYITNHEGMVYGLYWNMRGDLWLGERKHPDERMAATTDYYEDVEIADACWSTDTELCVKTNAGIIFEVSLDRQTLSVRRPARSAASRRTQGRDIDIVPIIAFRRGTFELSTPAPAVTDEQKSQNPSLGDEPQKAMSSGKPQTAQSLDELLLFFPAKHPAGDWNPAGLKFEDLWCTAEDKTRIHGWYCPCANPRATLLIAHGNAGNIAFRAPLLRYLQSRMQVAAFMFDYRGYGRSEGVPTVEGALQDARAARAGLAERAGIKESAMVLMGESLGGAIVVQLAAESAPQALILQSTFSSLRDVADVHYPTWSWLVPPTKLDSAAQIGRFHGPVLQSHGTADRTIPFSLGENLFESANEPKIFVRITGADHNNWFWTEEYLRQLDAFIPSSGVVSPT